MNKKVSVLNCFADLFEGKEVESPNDPLVDEKLINILRKQNASMRAALHEETVLRKENVRQLRSLESENEKNRRELADLRSLLLTLQTEHAPHELEIKETIKFPIHLESKIVSFGGHPAWLTEMRKLLPDIAFYSPEVIPNTDVLRAADEVWIQTNCISHGSYYRIVNYLSGYQTQIRYFGFSSARKCAEQLVMARS